jgi:hypothetical protein
MAPQCVASIAPIALSPVALVTALRIAPTDRSVRFLWLRKCSLRGFDDSAVHSADGTALCGFDGSGFDGIALRSFGGSGSTAVRGFDGTAVCAWLRWFRVVSDSDSTFVCGFDDNSVRGTARGAALMCGFGGSSSAVVCGLITALRIASMALLCVVSMAP